MSEVFDSGGKPRIDVLKQQFVHEGRVTDEAALKIIRTGAALLREESTVLNIDAPLTGEHSRAHHTTFPLPYNCVASEMILAYAYGLSWSTWELGYGISLTNSGWVNYVRKHYVFCLPNHYKN